MNDVRERATALVRATSMHGYVNTQVSIAIVRATHLCLRGSRIPTSHMSRDRHPQREDKAGFGLYRESS
jgi:hypothetical protein